MSFLVSILAQIRLSFPSNISEACQKALVFTAPHDYGKSAMPAYIVWIVFLSDLWVWYKTYYEEKDVAMHAHKKYHAQGKSSVRAVAIHAISGVTETFLGLMAMLSLFESSHLSAAHNEAASKVALSQAMQWATYATLCALFFHVSYTPIMNIRTSEILKGRTFVYLLCDN